MRRPAHVYYANCDDLEKLRTKGRSLKHISGDAYLFSSRGGGVIAFTTPEAAAKFSGSLKLQKALTSKKTRCNNCWTARDVKYRAQTKEHLCGACVEEDQRDEQIVGYLPKSKFSGLGRNKRR